MTTLRYQGNPPPSRPNRPDSTQNRSRPVLASPSSDLPPGLPPQLLELSDGERSKVLALDHRVLSKLYDVLALPSDIRGRVIPLRYDGKQPFTYRDKVPRSRRLGNVLGRGRLPVEQAVWSDGPDASRHRLHHHRVGSPVP